MKRLIILLLMLQQSSFAETTLLGNIFKVDDSKKTFELLKETEYDPKSDITSSRVTIHWTDATEFLSIEQIHDFTSIKEPTPAKFYGIDQPNRKALAEGKAFVARVAELHTTMPVVDPKDGNTVAGIFTPGTEKHSGTLLVDGKSIPVSLRKRFWQIHHHSKITPAQLTKGFWKATLLGNQSGEQYTISSVQVSALPDPRLTDDPKLPRVLVIGDSISMNYHEAAKAAVAGTANYHRNEGNSYSSGHGVANSELWLGNYFEKGLHWDVIQFNHGLHDLKQAYDAKTDTYGEFAIPIETYKQNLEKQIGILKKTGATLIWCNTTPVPTDIKSQYSRRKESPALYNAAALEVMKKHPEILITDLYGVVETSAVFQPWWQTKDPHFYKPEEQQALGQAVAETIKKAIAARKK